MFAAIITVAVIGPIFMLTRNQVYDKEVATELVLANSSGYLSDWKNNGNPENDSGEIGPITIKEYSFWAGLLCGSLNN